MTRVFNYNGATLEDTGGTPDEVRKQYAAVYPALTNASVVGPKKNADVEIYEFKTSVGTKG